MSLELHPQVCLVRVPLGHVSAHRQTFTRKYVVKKELKISAEQKVIKVSQQLDRKKNAYPLVSFKYEFLFVFTLAVNL